MHKLEDVKFGAMVIHQGVNPSVSLSKKEFDWLIGQAETLQRIADTWVTIETNGTSEDADNFYTTVQDILTTKTRLVTASFEQIT